MSCSVREFQNRFCPWSNQTSNDCWPSRIESQSLSLSSYVLRQISEWGPTQIVLFCLCLPSVYAGLMLLNGTTLCILGRLFPASAGPSPFRLHRNLIRLDCASLTVNVVRVYVEYFGVYNFLSDVARCGAMKAAYLAESIGIALSSADQIFVLLLLWQARKPSRQPKPWLEKLLLVLWIPSTAFLLNRRSSTELLPFSRAQQRQKQLLTAAASGGEGRVIFGLFLQLLQTMFCRSSSEKHLGAMCLLRPQPKRRGCDFAGDLLERDNVSHLAPGSLEHKRLLGLADGCSRAVSPLLVEVFVGASLGLTLATLLSAASNRRRSRRVADASDTDASQLRQTERTMAAVTEAEVGLSAAFAVVLCLLTLVLHITQKPFMETSVGTLPVADLLELSAYLLGFAESVSQFCFLFLLSRRFRAEFRLRLGIGAAKDGDLDAHTLHTVSVRRNLPKRLEEISMEDV